MSRIRLFVGISVFWIALSMLFDGINTLILPAHLLAMTGSDQATPLGLIRFVGLAAGMLVMPFAGAWSDRMRMRWGRRGILAAGLVGMLIGLALFGVTGGILAVLLAYSLIHIAASTAQAGQQGFLPDLVSPSQRGIASGWKGFADLGGSMLGFVVLGQLLGQGQTSLALGAIAGALVVTFLLTAVLVREPIEARHNPSLAQAAHHGALLDAFRLDLHQHSGFVWLIVSRFLFLLGTYAVGAFLLYFVANRLGLAPERAAEQAGTLLFGLLLISVIASPIAGWAADRVGRIPMMLVGSVLSAAGALLLIMAASAGQIFAFGALMALGSAAFASANWAMTADLVPLPEAGRFFALANFGTAGAAAAAGLFGPLVDLGNAASAGMGYAALFIVSALAFLASAAVLPKVAAAEVAAELTPSG